MQKQFRFAQKNRFYLWSKFRKYVKRLCNQGAFQMDMFMSTIQSIMMISLREFFIIVSIAKRKPLTYAV